MGRWSSAYSFRSADFRGDRPSKPSRRDDEPGGNPCARGEWCASARRELLADGTTVRTAAKTWQAFCTADREILKGCLHPRDGFPALHRRLAEHVGDFFTAEVVIRVPFGPNVLLRVDVDGVMRHIVAAVCSWHERVARVDHDLTAPDTQATHAAELGMRSGALLPGPCKVLLERVDALLALEPEAMARPDVPWLPSVLPADAVVAGAWADCLHVELGGGAAGNELLRLDYLGRAVLLETDAPTVRLLGVPCRACDRRALRRAAPPQHDGDPEWWSVCALCRDLMSAEEYAQWVKLAAAYYGTHGPAVLGEPKVA